VHGSLGDRANHRVQARTVSAPRQHTDAFDDSHGGAMVAPIVSRGNPSRAEPRESPTEFRGPMPTPKRFRAVAIVALPWAGIEPVTQGGAG